MNEYLTIDDQTLQKVAKSISEAAPLLKNFSELRETLNERDMLSTDNENILVKDSFTKAKNTYIHAIKNRRTANFEKLKEEAQICFNECYKIAGIDYEI